MKLISFEFQITSRQSFELLNVTNKAEEFIHNNKLSNGLLLIFSPHTTMGITINELEPGLARDIQFVLAGLVPKGSDYEHNVGAGEFNADAHIKNILIGQSATVPVQKGRLSLGTWQKIIAIETDGGRQRTVKMAFFGEVDGF